MSNRRTRFREYMARLNAAASPAQTLESGYYVKPPAELSIAHEVSARLELQPASTHLIVGGVGSGKTTEMLAACRRLADETDIAAIYVDVSSFSNLEHFDHHMLLDALIRGLAEHLKREIEVQPNFGAALRFYDDWQSRRPQTTSEHDVYIYIKLADAFKANACTPVIFMDSLDRLADPMTLEAALREHAHLLRKGHTGLVLAASLRLRHGLDRSLRDLFDQSYNTPYIRTDESSGLTFLASVLRARVPESLIDDDGCKQLAKHSGGVLRDLITLAQAAVNEGYVRGGDRIISTHIQIAADGFGRKQLLGLDTDEIATLQRVRTKGTFVQTSKKDLALLLTRHVLEHQDANGKTIYSVHPTIEPLLEQIAGAA